MAGTRAVLLDFGDTLFMRAGGHRAVLEAAALLGRHDVGEDQALTWWRQVQGASRSPEELAKGRDLSPEAHLACWTHLYGALDVHVEGIGAVLAGFEQDPRRWRPFSDTVPTLVALSSAGVRLGVVSDTGWDVRPVLAAAGVEGLIGSFVLSGEQGVAKPAPELFLLACEQLGVDPAAALMVGDSYQTDGGAVEAGVAAYLLPRPTPSEGPRGLGAVVELVEAARKATTSSR
ncbi:MAG: HAD family hydrolase [Acidimicrobiales bacterium]